MYRNVKRIDGDYFLTKEEVLQSFLDEKQALGLADRSIEDYRDSISRFCDVGPELIRISEADIYSYINILKDRGNKTTSINHHLRNIRAFCKYCQKHGYMKQFDIKLVKCQEEPLKYFTDEEIKILLKKPDRSCSFKNWRTYAIICTILATGARASTLINIKKEDVDFQQGYITYRHLKNKKAVIIPLSNELSKVLREFIRSWDIKSDYLFPAITGNQLTVNGLRQALEEYEKARGTQILGPHALRHSFARLSIINGMGVFQLQKMLTHSSITMTQRYVNLFSDDLKNNYEKVCPLDTIRLI